MLRSRTIFFLVSGILLLLGCASQSKIQPIASATPEKLPVWTDSLRSQIDVNRYQVHIVVKTNTISGICLLKKTENGWRGSLINEMGAKAFDFTVTEKECKLMNVISMLDKWYIRKTIAEDLFFLFQIDHSNTSFQHKTVRYAENGLFIARYGKNKFLSRSADNKITLENRKRKLVYILDRIE